jgi:multiple RNA-binding domain-containing protein 1
MGYGFVEFGSIQSVQDAMKKLQGSILDGHTLVLKPSSNSQVSSNTAVSSSSNKATEKLPTKLMVRNVPFQASRKELLQLFGSFGQLKRVRLPKKFDGSHRGFAFIEYVTAKEAEAAMKSLSRTHLYGRHLVLEWASPDEETDNINNLRTKAERDVRSATAVAAAATQFQGTKTKFE